jgi:hypothetical protein
MSNIQVQLRRGTTAQHGSFTGAQGELTVDTDKNALVLHDGATAGGIQMARESVVNVLDYGASPTASASDNATAINNALSNSTNKILDLGSGTYSVNQITSSLDNLHIINGTLVSNDTTQNCLQLSGKNIKIDNVNFTSNYSYGDARDVANNSIYALSIDTGVTTGTFEDESSVRVTNCKFSGYKNSGIYIAGYDFAYIENNILSELGNEGIRGSGCNNVHITNNQISSVFGGAIQHQSGGSTPPRQGLLISNNRCSQVYPGNTLFQNDTQDHGIAIELNSVWRDSRVIGNYIEYAHSMGISLSSASGTVVDGNVMYNIGNSTRSTDDFSYRGFASLEVVNADWCVVSNNKFEDPYARGINLDKSHDVLIEGNHFNNTPSNTRQSTQYFILLTGSAQDINNATWGSKISNNVFNNGGENDTTMDDSLCYGIYYSGFNSFLPNHKSTISNNKFIDCVIEARGDVIFDGNDIKSNGVLDISTSTAWAKPLLYFVNETTPTVIRNSTYNNTSGTASVGFIQLSSSNQNSLYLYGCEINNTNVILYLTGGFIGRLVAEDNRFTNITTNFTNRNKNGSNWFTLGSKNVGDRLSDFPRVMWGPGTGGADTALNDPIAGDIVFDITPTAGGKIGWVYDGTQWKQFGVIDA